jgi:hypothetical protein
VSRGLTLKFLIDARNCGEMCPIYFLNSNYKLDTGETPEMVKYHYFFASEVLKLRMDLDTFNTRTYFRHDKPFYAGSIQEYTRSLDSSSGRESSILYGIQFFPDDVIAEKELLRPISIVKAALRFIRDSQGALAFVSTGHQQTVKTIVSEAKELGVQLYSIDALLQSISYIPMNTGEAWGYLRLFPKSQEELDHMDIPVFLELPLTLSVVSGVITKAWQDPGSHIALKSRERDTPDMVLRNVETNEDLLGLNNAPVHLVVGETNYFIERASDEIVQQKARERFDKPWIPMAWNRKEKRILSYDDMCPHSPGDCLQINDAFGTKASNLGFLAHREVLGRYREPGTISNSLGYNVSPVGFGVPFWFYDQLVSHPDNVQLRRTISLLIELEKSNNMTTANRVGMVEKIQTLFYEATMPPVLLKSISQSIQSIVPDSRKLKLRSSANAEDIKGFDGAGLYDSFSADLSKGNKKGKSCKRDGEKMKPKSLECAIKGVYASLWNKRAIEERNFARLEHLDSVMGIAVVPQYKSEGEIVANSVVVTRVDSVDVPGYSLSVQKGNTLVTNPSPGTSSELTIATMDPSMNISYSVIQYAKPDPSEPALSSTVLDIDMMTTMVQIAKAVESSYCSARPEYSDNDCRMVPYVPQKTRSLDMEFKVYEDGRFLCKQVREFNAEH